MAAVSPRQRILVIVNPGGGDRQSAVDKAMSLARLIHASVELMICKTLQTVQDEPSTPAGFTPERLLGLLAIPFRDQGIEVSTRIIVGDVLHTAILEYLPGSHATLMIKDTHHHSLPRRTLLKNTDWHLAHGSNVPVLLTKRMPWNAKPPRIMAAVIPYMGRPVVAAQNRSVLECAAALTAGFSRDLQVMHAFVPLTLAAAVSAGTRIDTTDIAQGLACESSFVQAQLETIASAYGVKPSGVHVEFGAPVDGLIQSTKRNAIDILVIGASSHGGWHLTVTGSTASAVLELLPCDVMIVPPHLS